MSKRFKLKFTIPSFQLCRSKDLSTFPGNPVPAIYRLSPVNPKAIDIGYAGLQTPPPSTPEGHRHVQCNHHLPFNFDTMKQKAKTQGRKFTSSRRNDHFLIDKLGEKSKNEESESLISCLTSFSDEFCGHEVVEFPETASRKPDKVISMQREKISCVKEVQMLRFQAYSQNLGVSEIGETTKTVMATFTVEGKVKESFAVVKKSKDPYEDFKRSMLEMITEMEMYEAKDLEQLLQCFLNLNSQQYHGVIVRAFMEIWQEMFCQHCVDQKFPNISLHSEQVFVK